MPSNRPSHTQRRTFGGAIVLAVFVSFWVAGCSAAPAPTTKAPADVDSLIPVSAPSLSAVPILESVAGLTLPTEAYRPTANQRNTIAKAVSAKLAECMSQFGFVWALGAADLPAPNQVDRLYGVADLAIAEQFGYHLPSTDNGRPNVPRPNPSLSPTQLLVLTGSTSGIAPAGSAKSPGSYRGKPIPAGGCSAQAHRDVLDADDIDPTRLADTITVGMWEKSKADPRVTAVVAEWSACMKESGYAYASPLDAGGDHPEWRKAPTPGQAEVRAAVADVKCKQSTNLIGIWFTLESGYEQEAIQLHLDALNRIRQQWQTAAAKAAQVLSR